MCPSCLLNYFTSNECHTEYSYVYNSVTLHKILKINKHIYNYKDRIAYLIQASVLIHLHTHIGVLSNTFILLIYIDTYIPTHTNTHILINTLTDIGKLCHGYILCSSLDIAL